MPVEEVLFKYEDDIINPCWDNVFKAIFTKDTPESRGALEYLLSAIIRRSLKRNHKKRGGNRNGWTSIVKH